MNYCFILKRKEIDNNNTQTRIAYRFIDDDEEMFGRFLIAPWAISFGFCYSGWKSRMGTSVIMCLSMYASRTDDLHTYKGI